MNKVKKLSISFVLAFFLVSFTGMAEINEVAEVSVGPYGIHWQPKVNYVKLALTVSRPDGSVYRKTFESGSSPYFDLSEGGTALRDGTYNYELRVIPFMKLRESVETLTKAGLSGYGKPVEKALTQSGYFSVKGGSIVTGGFAEAGSSPYTTQGGISQPLDVVYIDDLIAQGSLCVGFDCINGENFGFDTLRLKENNLRIHFQDTSSSASFPTTDWRIIINDSANGGASYFGIEDSDQARRVFTLEANAPAHSLYVDDYGRVGLGTSTPVLELHIADGDTPTVRLDQDGSSGWSPQAWDVAGNEANFFIRDVTHSSKLPFRIQPGAPENSLTIKSDGKIGLGTWSPAANFDVKTTSANCVIMFDRTDGATGKFTARPNEIYIGTSSDHDVVIVANNNEIMRFHPDGTLNMSDGGSYNGTWNPASSRELKENIEDLSAEEAFAAIEKINPVKYNYKKDKEEARVGFIAEDVPELVANNGRKNLSTIDIVATLTKVVQEQQKTISELNKRISNLEEKSGSDKK